MKAIVIFRFKLNLMKLNPTQIHNLKQLISFYEEIPAEEWCKKSFYQTVSEQERNEKCALSKRCVLGHLGMITSSMPFPQQAINLMDIVSSFIDFKDFKISKGYYAVIILYITQINDSPGDPKENILNYLKQILREENIKH